jgi:hypothetical protein
MALTQLRPRPIRLPLQGRRGRGPDALTFQTGHTDNTFVIDPDKGLGDNEVATWVVAFKYLDLTGDSKSLVNMVKHIFVT